MNIPGYYYDKEKNRYFKITNGASNQHSYHNNDIQKQKRLVKHEKDKTEKKPQGMNKSLKYKLHYKQHNLINYKLGLVVVDPSILEFERLSHLRLKKFIHYNGQECKIWDTFDMNNEVYLIITNQIRSFMTINVTKVLNDNSHIIPSEDVINRFEDDHNLNEVITKLNLLPFEYLTMTTFKNVSFYNTISESDLDNPQIYQNFIKLEAVEKFQDKYYKVNKCASIYKFLIDLPHGEIKKDLNHLFGMNIIDYNQESSDITYNVHNVKACKRFFITFSKFTEDYLILGTNLGIIYLIKFKMINKDIRFFQEDIIKFKFDKLIKLDKINKIIKLDNYLIITSFKTIIIINLTTHEKSIYQLNEVVINMSCFELVNENFLKLVVISHKKIIILQFNNNSGEKFETLRKFDIFNHNTVNQFSFVSKNNLVLNQNNNELLIINLINYKTNTIDLKINKFDRFNGMIKLHENYLLINFKNNDNTNRFNIYQV